MAKKGGIKLTEQKHLMSETLMCEEYQLALNGAKLCIEKLQAAAMCKDNFAGSRAASDSIMFYDRCLELIRNRLSTIDDEKGESNDLTEKIQTN